MRRALALAAHCAALLAVYVPFYWREGQSACTAAGLRRIAHQKTQGGKQVKGHPLVVQALAWAQASCDIIARCDAIA